MKTIISLAMLIISIAFLSCLSSCTVFVLKDNGTHKGWYKNSNNPHHPYTTNPAKNKGNSKNKYK